MNNEEKSKEMPSKVIPGHHSPVNHIMAETSGEKYQPLQTLEEARVVSDGVVILEGDWGGSIFATCPVKYIKATHQEIETLCQSLEASFFPTNIKHHGGGWGVFYQRKSPGDGVWGGMGGGLVIDGLWIHAKLGEILSKKIISDLKYTRAI